MFLILSESTLYCLASKGNEVHAVSAASSRVSPIPTYKTARTSIRQVSKLLAGNFKKLSIKHP